MGEASGIAIGRPTTYRLSRTIMCDIIEKDRQQYRRDAFIDHVLSALRPTVQLRGLTPDTPVDDIRIDWTDASAQQIAPLAEAIDILEAIVWASDGCVGHRQCTHSMKPWQRARALLEWKWKATINRTQWPQFRG